MTQTLRHTHGTRMRDGQTDIVRQTDGHPLSKKEKQILRDKRERERERERDGGAEEEGRERRRMFLLSMFLPVLFVSLFVPSIA